MEFIFINNYEPVDQKVIVDSYLNKKVPKIKGILSLQNEIKPCDLYCYLYAKFGQPNGVQNITRNDDSDNLIHWDWTLSFGSNWITFMGMNFKTEIHLLGEFEVAQISKEQFISSLKNDFKNYGKQMSKIKKEILEDWEQYINPYHQIRSSILELQNQLKKLQLNPQKEKLMDFDEFLFAENFEDNFKEISQRYSFGIGLSYSLRILIPIMAESFINFIIFILCIPKIKENRDLFENYLRCKLDIKVQMLHINCKGFIRHVDWQSEECRKYHSLINTRNDLLHGNVNLKRLKINEVHFNKKVPVFKKYESIWQKTLGVKIDSSGFHEIHDEYKIVDNFIQYVLSCLEPKILKQVKIILNAPEFGVNKENSIIGILFPNHIADFRVPLIQFNKK